MSRSRSISPSTASAGTSAAGFTPSRPLYDFTSGGAFTSTSAVNANGAPSAGSSVQSIVGRSIGSIPTSATAREYQPVRWSRSASSTTVSRPTWRITSGLGALPLRNPGTRTLRDRSDSAWSNAWSTSPAGTSISRRTRLSASSETWVFIRG